MQIERKKSQGRSRRFYFALACLLAGSGLARAQSNTGTTVRPEDVASPSAVVKASYVAISGPPGQVLNLDRFRSLFLPQAQLVSVNMKDGQGTARVMTLQEFTDMVTARIGKDGHIEHEIAQRVDVYGNMANVWSSYESRKTPDDGQVMRGINSIQLMYDGKRWWISGAQWQHETGDAPIPAKYLSGAR
ncbi:MAG TPA: hypothetical protein VKR57_05170 [Terriglobales bacterium]|jgi:hypothetical protein|nr:hypothetical protein [Terriglobales bacterium]